LLLALIIRHLFEYVAHFCDRHIHAGAAFAVSADADMRGRLATAVLFRVALGKLPRCPLRVLLRRCVNRLQPADRSDGVCFVDRLEKFEERLFFRLDSALLNQGSR
jgi:hypothetical protein